MSYELAGPSGFSRREFMTRAAKSFLGVSIGATLLDHGLGGNLFAAGKTPLPPLPSSGKAKNVSILRMRGAMTHIDTFDPKPGTPEQGETKPISTKTAGIQLGEHLP